jgi:hypothetical protein
MTCDHLDILWPVFVGDPLERDHPLNQGRFAWHSIIPDISGGRQLFDLCAGSHLTIGSATVPMVVGTTRPGGFGDYKCDGSIGARNDAVAGGFSVDTPHSAAFWVKLADASTLGQLFCYGDSAAHQGVNLSCASGVIAAKHTASGFTIVASPATIVVDIWYFVVYVYIGGGSSLLYINGVSVATATATPATATVNSISLGENLHPSFPERAASGTRIGDPSLWSRALTASEVQAGYDLSRAGYPGLLRRSSPSCFGVAADTTPPTLSTLAVSSAGTTLTATLSESGCLPASGTGGFTLAGTSATVSSWAISGTTLTLTLSGTVYSSETVTLSYARASTTDDIHDAAGNFLADFSGASVSNGSVQTAGFYLLSAGASGFLLLGRV